MGLWRLGTQNLIKIKILVGSSSANSIKELKEKEITSEEKGRLREIRS